MKTKYICPDCRDQNEKVNLEIFNDDPRPTCPVCGFTCRRWGNTIIQSSDDRRGVHFHAGNWDNVRGRV